MSAFVCCPASIALYLKICYDGWANQRTANTYLFRICSVEPYGSQLPDAWQQASLPGSGGNFLVLAQVLHLFGGIIGASKQDAFWLLSCGLLGMLNLKEV